MSEWMAVAKTSDFSPDMGGCLLVDGEQIAVFNFGHKEWYAVQNRCPHENQMVLSRGLCGDKGGEPKVACPLHKNSFNLKTGEHLGGNPDYKLKTYAVKVTGDTLYLKLES